MERSNYTMSRESISEDVKRKFETFDELKKEVAPLLLENKTIYENYYLGHNKKLWDKFELKILVNNRKIKNCLRKILT